MSKFTDYLNSVNGVAINVDGQFGAQCWDSWSHYATNLIGVSPARLTYTGAGGWHAPHPGFTCAIWFGFERSGLNQWFTPFGPTVKAQPGDVAIWDYGTPPAPYSHIAIVVEDRGNALYCMTQNPGPNHYGLISKAGLLGYLRPDNQSFFVDGSAPAPAPSGGKTHTVVSGDTLWGLAQNYLGDGTRYMEIFNASNFRSGDPNLIFPGEIAVIP